LPLSQNPTDLNLQAPAGQRGRGQPALTKLASKCQGGVTAFYWLQSAFIVVSSPLEKALPAPKADSRRPSSNHAGLASKYY
jgi:hypothetical protein